VARLLNSLVQYQHQLVIGYFCLFALSRKFWIKTPGFFSVLLCATVAIVVLATAAYGLTIVLYLAFPNYFDHGQAIVASISWLWMQGHDLYPDWEAADVYGSVYGPILFLLNGIALQLNPTIFTSKVPGVLAFVVALAVMSVLIKKKTSNSIAWIFLFASLLMVFVPFHIYVYWNRPEPFLILVTALALIVAVRSPTSVAAVGVGILAGVAAGIKIHGFIYTIPAAVLVLVRIERLQSRLVMAIIASACAVGVALFSYLGTGASMEGYLRFLKVALRHGWSADQFFENLLFAFVLTAPIIGISIWRKRPLNPAQQGLLQASCISIAMLTVIGAKPGGGVYYFLPMVPNCIYGVAVLLESSEVRIREFTATIFICLFLAYCPSLIAYIQALRYVNKVAAQSELTQIGELRTYVESYPEGQIGISDQKHFSSYYYRTLSVFSGRPLRVDFSVWMDLAYAGVDEQYISRFIKACKVPVWILPLGAPFTMVNKYNNLPLLSEEFRQTFLSNYRQIMNGHSYQVWECNTKPHIGD